jgi:hypothetical protein
LKSAGAKTSQSLGHTAELTQLEPERDPVTFLSSFGSSTRRPNDRGPLVNNGDDGDNVNDNGLGLA